MKSLVLAFILMSTISYAQPEAEVAKAVEALKAAMLDGNKAALENIAADDLSYGHSSGLVEDKKTFVENIVSGNSDFVTITLSDQTIRITGNNAVVRHKLVADTNNNGTAGKANISVLLVWIKLNGQWKLLARQAVKI